MYVRCRKPLFLLYFHQVPYEHPHQSPKGISLWGLLITSSLFTLHSSLNSPLGLWKKESCIVKLDTRKSENDGKIILGLTCKIQQYMVNYKKYFVLEWEEIVSVDEQQRIS